MIPCTAKHFLSDIWLEKGVYQFSTIQKWIDKFKVPLDIGRIPYKIASGFSSFTTDQLTNWIVYFSLISMCEILTDALMEHWRHFVLACRKLLQFELTVTDISLVDTLLLWWKVESLYGKASITPNMHLHLKEYP